MLSMTAMVMTITHQRYIHRRIPELQKYNFFLLASDSS